MWPPSGRSATVFRDGFEDAAERGCVGDAHVVLDEARGASGVEEEGEGEVGGGLGGGDGVEGEAGVRGEGLACALEAGWARRKDLEERLGEGEGFGREGFEDGGEGFLLVGGGDDCGVGLAVAAEVVAVVEAADFFDVASVW